MAIEKASLEETKNKIIQSVASDKKRLKQYEDGILEDLESATGNILDNQGQACPCGCGAVTRVMHSSGVSRVTSGVGVGGLGVALMGCAAVREMPGGKVIDSLKKAQTTSELLSKRLAEAEQQSQSINEVRVPGLPPSGS